MKKIFFLLGALCLSACEYSNIEPKSLTFNLPATPYNYLGDTANNHVPTLGRVLFYDPRLSVNSTISCASCHEQSFAFSDSSKLSQGFDGRPGTRNSMPIQNLTVPGKLAEPGIPEFAFFWDGRSNSLQQQVLMPITNPIEMGLSVDNMVARLNQFKEYKPLIQNAFGSPVFTKERVSTALRDFLSSIKADKTKFDSYLNGTGDLTALEKTGMKLFFDTYQCNSCHQVTMLNGYWQGGGFTDIGLDEAPKDMGRADVTRLQSDEGKFKIPSLRNVTLTAPYMHDGRFKTLDEVMEHYSQGILNSPNLDRRLRKNNIAIDMNISQQDKEAIIAFLETLTDHTMVTDPKFASPFK